MTQSERKRTPFGQRMAAARAAVKPRKLTQEEVCRAIGIKQGTLSELETKASGSAYTASFAALYGVDAHWLETGEGPMRPATGAAPPPKPPKHFEDRRLVTPSQWALLHAIEDLMPDKEKQDYLLRWERTRERALAEIRESSQARGMSVPMDLDALPSAASKINQKKAK